jgi:PAS domain S-box-containing protein
MNVSMKFKFIAGVTAILVFLFTAGFISLDQLKKHDEARDWVVHTLKVITQLHFIRATVKDAEIAEQGYLLTGNKQYLALFSDSAPKIDQLIEAVRDLTQDNPKQRLQVSLLSTKVNEKLSQLKETIDLAHSNKRQEALADINSGRGEKLLLDVRRIVAEMMTTENQLLEERRKTVRVQANRTTTVLMGSITIAGILLLCLSGLLWRFITERKKAEEELKLSQERYDLAVEGSHDGIWDWDLANDKMFYSDLAYTQLGYTPGEIDITSREKLFFLIHPEDLSRVQSALADHLEHKKPYDIEYRLRTKSGDYKWIHSRGQAVWNYAGIPTRFAGSHRDITERVQSQEKLAQSEGRFRQMADNIKEIFWITDARGATPIYVSPAYEHVFGRTVDSLMAQPHQFFEATYPEDRQKLAEAIRCQREVTYSSEIEYRITRPGGEIRWLWARLSSIVDANNHVVGLCGVTYDITERKEVELRVSEFYSTVSHELRTPLTSIRGSLGLIEGGLAGEVSLPAMQMIKIGREESDRLIRLINDILDIKKVEAGLMELHKEQVEPQKLVSETLDAIAGMAAEAQVTLSNHIDTGDKIYGDTERLMQVLTNLLSNAIKFSPCNGEVSVSVADRPNQMLRLAVRDHGPGIPAHKMHRLFGKFQQLDSSDTRKKGGTGLGLAISKAIVEQHGGSIGVESEEGNGSEFWFDIPIDKRNCDEDSGIKSLAIEADS